MLFVNPVINYHSRLLYIMGATWHTKCMFDLATREPSFAQLLNQQGIETYAVDIIGSGPGPKDYVVGNRYQDTINLLCSVVEKYNIDHVMGYSTGCAFAIELSKKYHFKKIVFLDPGARTNVPRHLVDNDKYIFSKLQIYDMLDENKVSVDAWTLADHVNSLSYTDELVTAAWPIIGNYLKQVNEQSITELKNNNDLRIFFTKHSLPHMREAAGDQGMFWPHISHWALIETHRKDLAQAVVEFVKHE